MRNHSPTYIYLCSGLRENRSGEHNIRLKWGTMVTILKQMVMIQVACWLVGSLADCSMKDEEKEDDKQEEKLKK